MIQRHLATLLTAVAAIGFVACDDDDPTGDGPDPTPDAALDGGGGVGGTGGQGGTGGVGGMGGQGGMGGVPIEEQSIGEFVDRTCFIEGDETPPELLDGLSRQLVDAIDCVRPGTLSDLPDGNWRPWDPTRRMLVDGRGVDDLLAAAADGDRTMVVKWAYRDVALQHLFYLWTLKSCDFAAPPGLSNHQNGLSVDLIEPGEWSVLMRAHGWEDNLPTDRPHFDYVLAEDVGLARLSLFAFQALHNRNTPDALVRLTGEFDAATQQALTDAPIGGFAEGLCDGGVQPPEPPEFGGPTIAQAAWRGCDAPIPLIEGLSAEIADTMACADPAAVAALDPCGEAGCLAIVDPPVPEWLEAATHAALLEVSTTVDAPIGVAWGGRDAALTWFFHAAQRNLSCPGAVPFPTVAPFASGRAVTLSQADAMDPAVTAAMADVGFVQLGDRDWLYPDGADLRALTVYAFQVLWNANRPDDPLATDGVLGPDTLAALDRAPIGGFGGAVCADLEPPDPPLGNDLRCVDDCFNQDCPGTYAFCAEEACTEAPCDADLDCSGLVACDDPARGSSPFFYCDDGRCRRLR